MDEKRFKQLEKDVQYYVSETFFYFWDDINLLIIIKNISFGVKYV